MLSDITFSSSGLAGVTLNGVVYAQLFSCSVIMLIKGSLDFHWLSDY